ncbi:MAG: DUF502 domain-containing protein [Betaproteobacteria bacterium]|nr:DUF502 domain-containing protein [Betaproteobacteria bacterium]
MKKYLITGLLIWIPLVITMWVLSLVVTTMDQSLLLLPEAWRPSTWIGVHVPGFGVILTLLVIFLTGMLAANILGQRLVEFWESLLARIPVVKTIYTSVKQVSDTIFSSKGEAFRKAVLVRFPHKDSWTVGFLTGAPGHEITRRLGAGHVSVFVPTTPNPTSGYMIIVPKADTVELDMKVDEALKYIVSMGVAGAHAQSQAPRSHTIAL